MGPYIVSDDYEMQTWFLLDNFFLHFLYKVENFDQIMKCKKKKDFKNSLTEFFFLTFIKIMYTYSTIGLYNCNNL